MAGSIQKNMDKSAEWATDELNEPHFWLILLLIAMAIIAAVLFAFGL